MATLEKILADLAQEKAKQGASKAPAVVRRKDVLTNPFAGTIKPVKPAEPGGWRGFVGDVMGSPIGKVLTGAGEVLALPGRTVTSGLKELVDVLDTDPNTTASWDDFKTQVKDPTFGFGKITGNLTGNKWVDRAIGFVGDVALDPLTYVTLGTSKFAGTGGRFALANLAKKTFPEMGGEKLAKIIRYGRSALSADEIARLGVNRSGLYMFGKFIPGTGKVGGKIEDILSHARVLTSDTRLGRAMQKAFTPTDFKDYRLMLQRGEVPDSRVRNVLSYVMSRDSQRAGEAAAMIEGQRKVVAAVTEVPQFDSVNSTLYRLLENDAAAATASEVEQAAHRSVRNALNSMHDDIEGVYRSIQGAEDTTIGYRENYFPRVETPEATEWRFSSKSDYARSASEYVEDPLATVGVYNPRKLKEGSEWFGFTLTADDIKSTDRLNELANLGGFKGKYFETDANVVLEKYVSDYAKQMGIAARYKDLADNGVLKELTDKGIDEVVVDPKAVKSQAQVVNTVGENLKKSKFTLADSASQALETAVTQRAAAQTTVAGVAAETAKVASEADAALFKLNNLQAGLDSAQANLNASRATFESLMLGTGTSMPVAARPVVLEYDKAQGLLTSLRDDIAKAKADEAAIEIELAAAQEADRAAILARRAEGRARMQETVKKATAEYQSHVDTISDTINYNMVITDNWDMIKSGQKFSGKNATTLNNASSWLGFQPLSPQKRGKLAASRSATGSLQKHIKDKIESFEWYKNLTSKVKINKTKVAEGSDDRFIGTVAGLLDDGPKYLDDARADAIWVIARDERFYNGDAPRLIQGARRELEDVLAAAEDVVAKTEITPAALAQSEKGAAEQSRIYAELQGIAPEVEAAGRRLQNFEDYSASLEARGLANSAAPVSQEDQMDFINRIIGERDEVAQVADEGPVVTAADELRAATQGEVGQQTVGFKDRAGVVNDQIETSNYLRQLDQIVSRGVNSYAELYSMIDDIKSLIKSRTWTAGKGEVGGHTLTAEDALVRLNATDGKSQLQRTLERADLQQRNLETITVAGDENIVSLLLAEKMSDYYLYSEVSQRFYGLTQELAQFGAVPDIEMLKATLSNVAEPLVASWRARVARLSAQNSPQLKQAEGVLLRLQRAVDNPSNDFLSVLLGDAGERMRNSVDNVAAGSPNLTAKGREVLDSATDRLQSAKADPTYLKSMHDREMVDAMDYLSAYDLDRHTLPDGTRGFLVRDSSGGMSVLQMPDGTALSFTAGEWESLYAPVSLKNAEQRAALTKLEDEIASRAARVENGRKGIKVIEQKRVAGKATKADAEMLLKLQNAVNKEMQLIEDLQKQVVGTRAIVEASDPTVRSMALEKMRILVNGNGQQQGWSFRGTPLESIQSDSAAKIAARRKNIQESWRLTEEAAVDASIKETAARANLEVQKQMLQEPERVIAQANRLTEEANAAAAKAAQEEVQQAPAEFVSTASAVEQRLRDARATRKGLEKGESTLQRQVNALAKSLESTHNRLARTAESQANKAEREVSRLKAAVAEAQAAYDTKRAVLVTKQAVESEIVPPLQEYIKMIDQIIEGTVDLPNSRIRNVAAPSEQVGKAMKRGKARAAAQAAGTEFAPRIPPEQAAELIRWARSARQAIDAFNVDPEDPIARMLLAQSQAESRFLMADVSLKQEQNILAQLKKGDVVNKIVRSVDEGWTSLEKSSLPRMQMPKDLYVAMTNLRRVNQPEIARVLNQFLGKYTSFFKAYATLSPGFHVRNAIGNTMMVFAAGADPRNMVRGLDIFTSLRKAIKEQVPFETWLEGVAKTVSPEELQHIQIAVRAAEAAGGGRIEEAFADFFKKGQTLSDNKATQVSRRLGERVEGSARFMLAYDSAVKGMDFNGSAARVRRYLFDYNDVGSVDMALRQIVPFWMWMSRNLPLQIVNQWTEPRTYAIYNQFMKNFGEEDKGDVVPKWLKQQGAVKIADNWYLSFDLGTSRVKEQFEMLAQPTRFLKDVNPILRVPFEVGMLNKKLYRGIPFSDKPVEVAGGPLSPAVLALAKMLGQTEELPGGKTGVSDKFNYTLMNLNPLAGTIERLVPSSEFYQERQLGSLASFFGLPIRQVTEGAREAELRRRKYEGE